MTRGIPPLKSHHKIRYYAAGIILNNYDNSVLNDSVLFRSWNHSEQLGARHRRAPVKALHAQQVSLYLAFIMAKSISKWRRLKRSIDLKKVWIGFPRLCHDSDATLVFTSQDQCTLYCQLWKHIQKIYWEKQRKRKQFWFYWAGPTCTMLSGNTYNTSQELRMLSLSQLI